MNIIIICAAGIIYLLFNMILTFTWLSTEQTHRDIPNWEVAVTIIVGFLFGLPLTLITCAVLIVGAIVEVFKERRENKDKWE